MSFDWMKAADLPIGWVKGMSPTRSQIERLRHGRFGRHVMIDGMKVHDDPRWFKYYWRIWTLADCPPADDAPIVDYFQALEAPPVEELSFKRAMERMRALCNLGEPFMVANTRARRLGPDTGWTPELVAQSGGARTAPAYDDDPDEPFFGHK